MVMRIIILAIVAVVLVGVFGNIMSQANMNSTIQNFQATISTIVYANEIDEIKKTVDEFLILRTIHETNERKAFAEKLDERLNNLQLVKTYCDQEISTLDLSYELNPYEKLQTICPKLSDVSFSKAVQLFKLI